MTPLLNLFISYLNRNSNAINDMAIRNPYKFTRHYETNRINEHKENNDEIMSRSICRFITCASDSKDYVKKKISSNQNETMNDSKNANNEISTNNNTIHSLSSVMDSSLLNQQNSEFLPALSNILKDANDNKKHQISSDVILSNVVEQTRDCNPAINNDSFVSHMPIMSSSSSSSSLSIPLSTLKEDKKLDKSEPILNSPNSAESL